MGGFTAGIRSYHELILLNYVRLSGHFTYICRPSIYTCMQHANQGSPIMEWVNHLIIDRLSELC